jgi:nitrogen fixation NifU-like protein
MMPPEAVARQIIDDHARRPRHTGELPGVLGVSRENPGCGDRVTVWAEVKEGRLSALRFSGRGCAVSQAGASLMTVALNGQPLERVSEVAAAYRRMVLGEGEPDPALGDLLALAGVSRLHARRRCALLAWDALQDALNPTPAPLQEPGAGRS